jgi:hypothetical protein
VLLPVVPSISYLSTLPTLSCTSSLTKYEVLQNFFKSFLNCEDHAASPGTLAVSHGAGTTMATAALSGRLSMTGPRTSSVSAVSASASVSISGGSQRSLMWRWDRRWVGSRATVLTSRAGSHRH